MPMGQLAEIGFQSAAAQVSREDGARRIVVETNVRGRDIQGVAEDIQALIKQKLPLPTGYFVAYGGALPTFPFSHPSLPSAPLCLISGGRVSFNKNKTTTPIIDGAPKKHT